MANRIPFARITGLALLFMSVGSLFAPAQEREFIDIEGRAINAKVVSVDGESCVLSVSNKEYQVPLERLSEADQDYLRSWIAPPPSGKPALSVNFSDRVDRGDSTKTQIFDIKVDVENQDTREQFPGGTVVIMAVAKHASVRDVYCIGFREKIPVGPISTLRKTSVSSKRYICSTVSYDNDNGWRYSGFIVLLYNPREELVAQSVSQGIDADYLKALDFAPKSIVTGSFRKYRGNTDTLETYRMPRLVTKDDEDN